MWRLLRDKHKGKVSKLFFAIISIAGLIISILSFIDKTDLGWHIVLGLVIFNSIFLICITIYETLIFKTGEAIESKIKKQTEQEMQRLKESQEGINTIAIKISDYIVDLVKSYNIFNFSSKEISTKFSSRLDDINRNERLLRPNQIDLDTERTNLENEYVEILINEYNHFLGNIFGPLKKILDDILKGKGLNLEVSVSLKQFNCVLDDMDNINKVKIITTFRDKDTYKHKKREIGKEESIIRENTDFSNCLSEPHFIKNNMHGHDDSYQNRREGFCKYYNCIIVVPVYCKLPNNAIHFFGYLTADVLNTDLENADILDKRMANVMNATGNIIGLYFDIVDKQWDTLLNNDFLATIYKLKYNKREVF